MPEHLISLLSLDMVADIVGLCDSILYKVLTLSKSISVLWMSCWYEKLEKQMKRRWNGYAMSLVILKSGLEFSFVLTVSIFKDVFQR